MPELPTCIVCEEQILPLCGYRVTHQGGEMDKRFCTVAHLAEWAGTLNMQMQSDFANEEEVDLSDRHEDEDEEE